MSKHDGLRALVQGWDQDRLATEGDLRAPAPPPLTNRTAEDAVFAALPGDDISGHPLHDPPNPWMRLGYFRLREMLESGLVPAGQLRAATAALSMKAVAAGQASRPLGQQEFCLAVDQTETLVYDQKETQSKDDSANVPVGDANGNVMNGAGVYGDLRPAVAQGSGD